MSLIDKANEALGDAGDKIEGAIDKAGDFVDEKSSGKFAENIDEVQGAVRSAGDRDSERVGGIMADENPREVQVWALATEEVSVPPFADDGPMTSERLSELRTVLAALANVPVATLEVHPLPAEVDRSGGIALGNTSSLAIHLSDLINQGPKAGAGTNAEALYRMVVPAKIAKQFGSGILQPMLSKSVPGGIHGALTNSSGIGGQAAFVKVAGAGVGSGVPIVASGLITMAVAAGLSMQIEASRRQITGLLKKQLQAKLDDERNTLDGCRNPIEKATAILLDQGIIGQAIGLSPKVGAIEDAIAAANRRVTGWEQSLAGFRGRLVESAVIKKEFSGIEDTAGEFRAHLELAALAIDLKRRVNVLQAVEQAQLNPGNPFERFMRQLSADEKRIDELENRIVRVVRRLSELDVDRSHGFFDVGFSAGEVDDVLRVSRELRKLGRSINTAAAPSDVAIEMVRENDGSVVVFPAHALR